MSFLGHSKVIPYIKFEKFGIIRFYRASAYCCWRAILIIVILSVCPSVRPSVRLSVRDTLVLYENGLTYRHSFSAQSFQFYGHQTFHEIPTGSPPAGALNTGPHLYLAPPWFSTNKSLYLANDTRYRHGYYGRRIGNRTQAFEWHQISRSRYYWTSNNSQMVQDRAIVTMAD